jgi:hypothetical protein
LEAELDAAVVSVLADLSPLLLHAVTIENNPAEAIIKNFFILMILGYKITTIMDRKRSVFKE